MSDKSKDRYFGPNGSDSPEANPETASPSFPPAPPASPGAGLPGDFGDYRFIERLGKGAFGEVFKVWSLSKCCYEAMKVLRCDGMPTSERLEAFRREVQRMAHVAGSHVAHVYHTGTLPDGRPYFTMEYLSGGPIDVYCDRHRKSIEDRILYVAEICEAVDRLGLVHCDIKPGNIVVGEESGAAIPKLVDFGLARLLAFESPTNLPVCGTLAYMSPEQLESRGGDPERRWDIYALGVTLYRLLVDEYPIDHFPGRFHHAEQLADYIRRTPIPPLVTKLPWDSTERTDEIAEKRKLDAETLRSRLRHRWLEPIVVKALAKDRDDRYASAGEMARNLRVFASGKRPPIVPPTHGDRVREFLRDHTLVLTSAIFMVFIAALSFLVYTARVAARNASIASLFDDGCLETDPTRAIAYFKQALERDPTRSDIRLQLAGTYGTSGDAELVVDTAGSIPKGDPLFECAQGLIVGIKQLGAVPSDEPAPVVDTRCDAAPGRDYYSSLAFPPDEAKSAIVLLDSALKKSHRADDRLRIRLMRAVRYYQAGDFDRLRSEAEQFVQMDVPESAVAWNLLGICRWKAGDKMGALGAYTKAVGLNPEYAAAYRNRGSLNERMRRYAPALEDCETAIRIDPSSKPLVQAVRLNAWLGLGDDPNIAKARVECETIRNQPVVLSQTHFACGMVWTKLNLPESAWNEFELAVNDPEPQNPFDKEIRYSAFLHRGEAAFDRKRYPDAISDFVAAEAAHPDQWRSDQDNYWRRGLALLLARRFDEAVVDLSRFAELRDDPGRSLVYLWIWDVRLATGQTAAAAEALERASAAAKADERMARIVGHCAEKVDRKTLLGYGASDPNVQVETYYYIGLAAKARGDVEDAAGWFQRCLQVDAVGQVEKDFFAEMQLSLLRPAE